MSEETLQIRLDSDVSECGDRFAGEISWGPLDNAPRGVRVELRYRTEGRGDTDTQVVSQIEVDGTASGVGRFELPVPADGPMSFDGVLIRVLWTVELVIDRALRPDPDTAVPVTVLPRGGLALWVRQHAVPPAIPPSGDAPGR